MFICEPCAKVSNIDYISMFRSYGNCEVCGFAVSCQDIRSQYIEPGLLRSSREVQDRPKTDA